MAVCEETEGEIEYIEPTRANVGEWVEVRDSDLQDWRQRKLIGVISYHFRFVVEPEGAGLPLAYKYARFPRPKPQPTKAPPAKVVGHLFPRAVRVVVAGRPGKYPVVKNSTYN